MIVVASRLSTRWKRRMVWGLYYAAAFLFVVLFLFPLVWTFLRSFQGQGAEAVAPTWGSLFHLTVENYDLLLHSGSGIWRYLLNSSLVAIATALLSCILSCLAGYGLSRFKFRGGALVFLVLLMPLMVPFQSLLAPLFVVASNLHLINNLAGLVLIYATFQLPFAVFVMRNSFDAIPPSIEEAAAVDGASTLRALRSILGPLAFPGIVTVALFAFLTSWNEFLAALTLLSSDDKYTLPIALANLELGNYGVVDFGTLDAGAVIAMIPCIALFLGLQRYYVRGLTSAAGK